MGKHKQTFLLVDGNAIIHRAFHALPPTLTDPRGNPTNAVYGFARILFSALKQFQPGYVAVAFDVAGKTFRDDLFKEYKAKRVKAPQELYDQIPIVHKMLDSLDVPHFGIEGFEADDIIGTLSKRIPKEHKDAETIILTGDGDTLQLVNSRVKVAMPARGIQPPQVYNRAAVEGKVGLPPENIIDYKALAGDSSDNIPGVPGVGPKTAVALIKKFGSLNGVYKDIGKVTPESLRQKLEKNEKSARLSYELATIRTDVKLNFKLSDTEVHDFDRQEAEDFFNKMGMRSIVKLLPESHRKNGDQTALF